MQSQLGDGLVFAAFIIIITVEGEGHQFAPPLNYAP